MFRKLCFLAVALCVFGTIFSVSARSLPKKVPSETITSKISLHHQHTKLCEETSSEPVQIICILDRSGSMQKLTNDTIGGYNSFLDKQKQNPGKADVTTILFDDQYEVISQAVDLNEAKYLESVGKVKIFISKLSSIKELAYETNDKITIFTSLSALRRSQYVSDVLSKLVKK